MTAIVSSKLRDSAQGQACTFCIPGVCNGDRSTTVLAHLPSEWKGMGNKSPDFCAAFACSSCHDHFDQRRLSSEDTLRYALRGMQRTQMIWIEMGLMKLPIDAARPTKSSKIVARRHIATGEVIS